MQREPALILPVVVAAFLIVLGRVNRRRWAWGNWIAIVGYAVLAVTIVIALVARV